MFDLARGQELIWQGVKSQVKGEGIQILINHDIRIVEIVIMTNISIKVHLYINFNHRPNPTLNPNSG